MNNEEIRQILDDPERCVSIIQSAIDRAVLEQKILTHLFGKKHNNITEPVSQNEIRIEV